jgi:hypothetical protein
MQLGFQSADAMSIGNAVGTDVIEHTNESVIRSASGQQEANAQYNRGRASLARFREWYDGPSRAMQQMQLNQMSPKDRARIAETTWPWEALAEAATCFRLAASNGSMDAVVELEAMYAQGLTVQPPPIRPSSIEAARKLGSQWLADAVAATGGIEAWTAVRGVSEVWDWNVRDECPNWGGVDPGGFVDDAATKTVLWKFPDQRLASTEWRDNRRYRKSSTCWNGATGWRMSTGDSVPIIVSESELRDRRAHGEHSLWRIFSQLSKVELLARPTQQVFGGQVYYAAILVGEDAESEGLDVLFASDGKFAGFAFTRSLDGVLEQYRQERVAVIYRNWSAEGAILYPHEQSIINRSEYGRFGRLTAMEINPEFAANIFEMPVPLVPDPEARPAEVLANVPFGTADAGISSSIVTTDRGFEGFVVWNDGGIYAQKISATGAGQWNPQGVAVCAADGIESGPEVVQDGAGGAIIAFEVGSYPQVNIFAQRISSDGATNWARKGVAICTARGQQQLSHIISDGNGGAIASWDDFSDGHDIIHAQRISSDGKPIWKKNGVALSKGITGHDIISDGSGGAIIAWIDDGLCVQRIAANGQVEWGTGGVTLCADPASKEHPKLVSDGAGGAIATWQDERGDGVYAQKISAEGAVQWAVNGVALCNSNGKQMAPYITHDGAGGAIVVWQDTRSGNYSLDIYAQRIAANGATMWAAGGVALCTATNDQLLDAITSDGAGGVLAVWSDDRAHASHDIYVQRLSASGVAMWDADGVAVCNANAEKGRAQIVSANGNCIVIWDDKRSGKYRGYAQYLDADGNLAPAVGAMVVEP